MGKAAPRTPACGFCRRNALDKEYALCNTLFTFGEFLVRQRRPGTRLQRRRASLHESAESGASHIRPPRAAALAVREPRPAILQGWLEVIRKEVTYISGNLKAGAINEWITAIRFMFSGTTLLQVGA